MQLSQTSSTLEIVNTLDKTTWRQFVDRHPQGNIFHTPEMFQVFARAKGYTPSMWAAIEDKEIKSLLLPVQLTLYDGLLRQLTTRAVAYGSVLACPAAQPALQQLLACYAATAAHQALFTELRNLSDLKVLQPTLQACKFVYEEHLDYLIDLTGSPDDVLQRIGARTRKHIRRGLQKQQVTVRQITEKSQVEICYNLIQKSYAIAGIPLADRSLFEAGFDVLHPIGMIQFWLASIGDTHVAASVELPYKDVVYGWYAGVDRAYSEHVPGELLMWHVLKWGAEHGYRIYDFGGAGKPGDKYGVRDFKAKFGGNLVCYGRNTCIHQPVLYRVSELGYRVLRRLRQSR